MLLDYSVFYFAFGFGLGFCFCKTKRIGSFAFAKDHVLLFLLLNIQKVKTMIFLCFELLLLEKHKSKERVLLDNEKTHSFRYPKR